MVVEQGGVSQPPVEFAAGGLIHYLCPNYCEHNKDNSFIITHCEWRIKSKTIIITLACNFSPNLSPLPQSTLPRKLILLTGT